MGVRLEDLANQMKKSTSLFDPYHSIYTWESTKKTARLQEIARRIQELDSLKKTDPDNADKYDSEKSTLEKERKAIEDSDRDMHSDPKNLMSRQLSEYGQNVLKRPV